VAVQQQHLGLHDARQIEIEADRAERHGQAVLEASLLEVALELGDELGLQALEHGQEQGFLGLEMVEDGALGHADELGQLGGGSVLVALVGEEPGGVLEDLVAAFHFDTRLKLSEYSLRFCQVSREIFRKRDSDDESATKRLRPDGSPAPGH